MIVPVKSILGIEPIPRTKPGALGWLRRQGIALFKRPVRGGNAFFVRLADLPEVARAAVIAAELGIDPGEAPAELLERVANPTAGMIAKRDCKLLALHEVEELLDQGLRIGEAIGRAAAKHGLKERTLRRARATVVGIKPALWPAVLMPRPKREGRKAEVDAEMWRLFLGFIKESGPAMALSHAYRETEKLAKSRGVAWPSYDAILARWNELPPQEQVLLKHGTKARDALIPYQTRSVAHLNPLAIVNLDGRYADVFVEWEDGTISRPIVLTAQDVFSRKVLARVYAKTENSDAIKELVLKVCERWGVPERILYDNGRGFNAKKLTGGTCKGFRCHVDDGTRGLFAKMGIEPIVAGPYNGKAKPIERHYREDAREIDARPEFKGAHCGGRPDAKPEDFAGKSVSIATFVEVYEACTAEQNARTDRHTEMCGGVKSFDQVFDESIMQHPRRLLTLEQRLYLSRDERLATPDRRTGEIRLRGHRYWSIEAQGALMRHCGKKVRVLYDSKNLAAGVRVEDMKRNAIVAELPRLAAGRFDSTEDARDHARFVQQVKRAEKLQERATRGQVLAEYGRKKPPPTAPSPNSAPVIKGNFSPAARPAAGRSAAELHSLADKFHSREAARKEAEAFGFDGELGDAATPPAQSPTRAEARLLRTKAS